MIGKFKYLAIVIAGIIFCSSHPSAADLKVEDISVSSLAWGDQTAKIKMTNLSYDYKTVVVKTDISFDGSEASPRRSFKNIFLIDPIFAATVSEPIEIPGNFGNMKLKFTFYDVVDTLDQLYDSQIFSSKELSNSFPVPESMKPYLQSPLALPMFVDKSQLFDSQAPRYYLLFLKLGKKPEEMAGILGTDLKYINFMADKLAARNYIKRSGGENLLNIAIIDNSALIKLRPKILETIEKVYDALKNNLPGYDSTITSLVSQGKLTRDRDNIMEPGSVLYHKQPVVLGLLLWNKLSHQFVNDGPVYNIFANSDPCRADMGDYMYLAVAQNDLPDKSFYYDLMDVDGERFYTSIGEISLDCEPVGESYKEVAKYYWNFPETDFPIIFSFDDAIDAGPLSILGKGCLESAESLKDAINSIYLDGGNLRLARGARYWCWNIVVSSVVDRLEKDGLIKKEGRGIYTFQKSQEE